MVGFSYPPRHFLSLQDAEGPTAGKFVRTPLAGEAGNSKTGGKGKGYSSSSSSSNSGGGGGGVPSTLPGHPLVAVPLPSGACYHLLDDFNHHHQVLGSYRIQCTECQAVPSSAKQCRVVPSSACAPES